MREIDAKRFYVYSKDQEIQAVGDFFTQRRCVFAIFHVYFAISIYETYRDVVFSEPSPHSASIDMRQPYTLTSSLEVGVLCVKNGLKL